MQKVFVGMSPHKSPRDLTGQAGGAKIHKVFVAMSGGVDSSVTAALLKERGFDVVGAHIKMWSDPSIPCNFKEDRYDAMRVAAHLDIPFETWDLTKEYKEAVVAYMIREYASGKTPNPDVMCNRHIKFGIFLQRALERGADFVATGHYVRLERTTIDNKQLTIDKNFPSSQMSNVKCQMFVAKDGNKDQSYFLWTLTQDQLTHSLFPIGDYTKPQVRELAKKFGLPTAQKADSQGICFIGEINVRDFLKNHIPVERGPVVTTSGKQVGEHEGLAFYTIGQREGLGLGGGGIPFYVAQKDFTRNTLVVAEGPYDEKLFSNELTVSNIHWISGEQPKLPLTCSARIRYRQPLQSCTIAEPVTSNQSRREVGIPTSLSEKSNETSGLLVTFAESQRAVTPGQSIVFYHGEPLDDTLGGEMLGGGIIV